MRKADKLVINITGDNNKVSIGERKSHRSAALIIALGVVVGATVLAVSHCCPDEFADFVRWIVSVAVGS